MLNYLSISNFILIEELRIDFTSGFNVITGETGAGKSILRGALALLLGGRVDKDIHKQLNQKCILEASFLLSKTI